MESVTEGYLQIVLLVSVIIVLIVVLVNHNINFSSAAKSVTKSEEIKMRKRCQANARDKASFETPVRMGAVKEYDVPVSMTVSGRYVENDFGKMY
jgi:hypothetical protein